jgi:hypothetical protein
VVENKRANRVVAEVAEMIAKGAPGLKVSTEVLEGTPKQLIVEKAEMATGPHHAWIARTWPHGTISIRIGGAVCSGLRTLFGRNCA